MNKEQETKAIVLIDMLRLDNNSRPLSGIANEPFPPSVFTDAEKVKIKSELFKLVIQSHEDKE
jgi:hypothetical protein